MAGDANQQCSELLSHASRFAHLFCHLFCNQSVSIIDRRLESESSSFFLSSFSRSPLFLQLVLLVVDHNSPQSSLVLRSSKGLVAIPSLLTLGHILQPLQFVPHSHATLVSF